MYPSKQIKKYIEDHHLKASSIAREMGIDSSKLSQIINNKRGMKVEELITFCAAVNTTPDKLLGIEKPLDTGQVKA